MQIDFGSLLTHATIHFVLGLVVGLIIAWILVSKTKKENHAEMLEILKQKNDIIAQKDDIIKHKEKENERQLDIFSKYLANLENENDILKSNFQNNPNSKNKS